MVTQINPQSIASGSPVDLRAAAALIEAGRVKFDQRVGPCVGDWYEMKDGSRYRFGLDLGERLKVAKDPSGKFFSLDANGVATYGGPLLDHYIQKWSLAVQEQRKDGWFGMHRTGCRVFKEK